MKGSSTTYCLGVLWKIYQFSYFISIQRLHLLFHGCNPLAIVICLSYLLVTTRIICFITIANDTWSFSHPYLISGSVTQRSSLLLSILLFSPSESEESSSDSSGLSENSTPFFWVFAKLFEAPPFALSFISDLSCNINSSSKITSLLVKVLFVSVS